MQHSNEIERDGLVDALSQAAFLVMGILTRLAADNDLSLTQLRVMAILRGRQVRMSDLVDYLGLEKSTLTGLITRAEARGLVERVPSATDRRAIEVLLTPAGRELAERVARQVADELEGALGDLGERDREQLRGLLRRILNPAPDA